MCLFIDVSTRGGEFILKYRFSLGVVYLEFVFTSNRTFVWGAIIIPNGF